MPYPKRSIESRTVAYERSRAAKWKRIRFRVGKIEREVERERDPSLGAGGGCWCGEAKNHDWPGRDAGAPHPLPKDAPDLPPRVLAKLARQALQEAGVCPVCRGYPSREIERRVAKRTVMVPWCDACMGMGIFPPPKSRQHSEWLKENFGGEV